MPSQSATYCCSICAQCGLIFRLSLAGHICACLPCIVSLQDAAVAKGQSSGGRVGGNDQSSSSDNVPLCPLCREPFVRSVLAATLLAARAAAAAESSF